MGGPPDPRPVSVRGGTGGIDAEAAQIAAMGRLFGALATDSLSASFDLHAYLVNGSLAVSAAFDPVGCARFEADLASALDGYRGLSWAGASAGLVDGELRLAAAAYERVEQVVHSDLAAALTRLPAALAQVGGTLQKTGDPVAAAQAALVSDPQLADLVIDALGIPQIVSLGATLLPDGHGVVTNPAIDSSTVGAGVPRQLTDVVTDLARRSDDRHHGEIDVRILTMPDGTRRAIVDITGTKSWDPAPTHDITSLSTNGRALVGESTAYEQGVLAAMRAAGVRPGDDVMLVGHSEGGMVAVTTARDAVRSGEFNVTHVITAGAPIGRTVADVPSGVRVLALENARDVVPHLDGAQNPDRANVTTATGDRGDSTIVGDHDVGGAYLPIAADVQASHSQSVRDFLHSAGGYLRAIGVRTHTYQIQRR